MAAAAPAFRRFFDFDAVDWASWRELHRQFMAGAALPLEFVALTLGLCLTVAAGMVFLAWRLVPPAMAGSRSVVEPPPPAPAPGGADPRPAAPGDADLAVFARAMAVFEVWSEPPPAWMAETLAEELARLSPAAWTAMEGWGEAAVRLRRHAEARGLVPLNARR